MSHRKISPAFERFFAEARPHDRREALVVYDVPERRPPPPDRLRTPAGKREHARHIARAQKPIEQKILKEYARHAPPPAPHARDLRACEVGGRALPVVAVQIGRDSLAALADQPDVVAILPNQKIHLIRPRSVRYETLSSRERRDGITWGLKALGVPELWRRTRGRGVKIAVLDTGVYADHPALQGRVKGFVVVDPLGRRIQATPVFDCGTHGTHVCGTIAGGAASGVAIGVAPEASLYVAAVLIGEPTLQTLVEGLGWAVDHGVDIVNLSLGFTYYEPLFAHVFQLLIDRYGILPVVAIGNENHGNTSSPGNAHNALAVGAVEKAGRRGDVPFFSSGASLVFPEEPADRRLVTKPDVVAPGVRVFSCIPPERKEDDVYEYSVMDGTSMAAPHVSGAAALLMAAKPRAPVGAIVEALRETAWHPSGRAGHRPDNRWGYGLIRPPAALAAL